MYTIRKSVFINNANLDISLCLVYCTTRVVSTQDLVRTMPVVVIFSPYSDPGDRESNLRLIFSLSSGKFALSGGWG